MKKIANIVTTARKYNYSDMFNVVNSMDDCVNGLPTLVVGWSNMKKWFPEADILTKECNGIKWTFSKTERRCDYEDDIIKFYNYSIMNVMKDIKYTYVDPIKFSLLSIKKVIKYCKGNDKKFVFLTKGSQFMFVYSEEYKTVFGVSLTLMEYIGISKQKVIRLVKNGVFIRDTSFINSDIRRIIGTNTAYILPLYNYFK